MTGRHFCMEVSVRLENRKIRRVPVNIAAKLDPGKGLPVRDCVVLDISEIGAQLAIPEPAETPDEFTILLTPSGSPSRHCQLLWRSTDKVGVLFDEREHRFRH